MPDDITFSRKYAFFALLTLFLAGSVGSFLRFGLVYGLPAGWGEIRNIVHAHSHTMFGWTNLALMTIIWRRLPAYTGEPLPKGVRWQMAATFLFSLSQLVAFWPNGYGVTQIGSAELPLGAISAGFAGLTWFWFMWLYWRATRNLAHPPTAVRLWHWAVVLLLIASMGAMAEPGLMAMNIESDFIKHLFLHLFLDLFTTGWLLLATFGALIAYLDERNSLPQLPAPHLMALFILPTFLLGMSPDLLPSWLFWIASCSNLLVAVLVVRYLQQFFQRRDDLPLLVKFGLLGLLVQVGAALLMVMPGVWAWGAGALRIFYLHDMLLLWTSSTLLGLLVSQFGNQRSIVWQRWTEWMWIVGVGIMWLALLLGGFVQWLPLSGRVLLAVAAWASVIIVLAAMMALKLFLPLRTRAQGLPTSRG
jgi:hypothetical protein